MAVFLALVSAHTPAILQHVCSDTVTWRKDTPLLGLSTHPIINVLSSPGNGVYVVLLPVPSLAVRLMSALH